LREGVEALAKRLEYERDLSRLRVPDRLAINDYLGAFVESERADRYSIDAVLVRDLLKAHANE
jgi:hypothetical protein